MRIVHEWLSELVDIPADVEVVAREISLRGFEVASVDGGVIDFEITANRPDCLSHLGIAREAQVIWPQHRGPRASVSGAPLSIGKRRSRKAIISSRASFVGWRD